MSTLKKSKIRRLNYNRNIQPVNTIIIDDEFYEYKDGLNIDVACILISHVIRKIENYENPDITYGELANNVGKGLTARSIEPFLGNVSQLCADNELPYISGVVVNKDTRIPGDGFFEFFYNIPKGDLDIFIKCKNQIIDEKRWIYLLNAIETRSRVYRY